MRLATILRPFMVIGLYLFVDPTWATNVDVHELEMPFDVESNAREISQTCAKEPDYDAVISCLNREVEKIARGEINDRFAESLANHLRKSQIRSLPIKSIGNLFDLYPVRVPLQDDFQLPLQCFDLSPLAAPSVSRRRKVEQIAASLLHMSLFTLKFARLSLGRPLSFVLSIDALHLCGTDHHSQFMRLNRETQILEMGMAYTGVQSSLLKNSLGKLPVINRFSPFSSRPFTAPEMWQAWQSGEAVEESLVSVTLGDGSKLDYALHSHWEKVNPTGSIRVMIRNIAARVTSDLLKRLKEQGAAATASALLQKIKSKSSTQDDWSPMIDEALSDDEASQADLTTKILEKLGHFDYSKKVLIHHMNVSRQKCSGAESQTNIDISHRDGFFFFGNAKVFAFDIGFGAATAYPDYDRLAGDVYNQDQGLCASTDLDINLNLDRTEIAIYPVDNLSLAFSGFNHISKALALLPELAMIEVLKERASQTQN